MRHVTSRRFPAMVALLVVLAISPAISVIADELTASPLTLITGPTPFIAGCNGAPQSGELYPNAEVEPWVAVNPTKPGNLLGAWQQDRWSNGSANGVLTGVSRDGGQTWATVMVPFSRCAGGNPANGGDFERASDPWVTFAPNGDVYQMALARNVSNPDSAMLVSKSTDGGATWTDPVVLRRDADPRVFNDKDSITADPNNANLVYAVWDRLRGLASRRRGFAGEHRVLEELAGADALQGGLDSDATPGGPTMFARTTDGGQTWEPAREIYDPGLRNQTVGNQIVVLPDQGPTGPFHGELVNVLTNICRSLFTCPAPLEPGADVAIIRSTDRGDTWSAPIRVSGLAATGVQDPDTGAPVRTGGDILPEIAMDPSSGNLYVVWQDSRFSGFAVDGIAFSASADGGLTWSTPVQINQTPADIGLGEQQAFTPTIRVRADGTIGVAYYDFRNHTPGAPALETDAFLVHSHDQGATWQETRLTAASFDLRTAPVSQGFFLGDYQGLAAAGSRFTPLFVQTNAGNTENRTDVFATTAGP